MLFVTLLGSGKDNYLLYVIFEREVVLGSTPTEIEYPLGGLRTSPAPHDNSSLGVSFGGNPDRMHGSILLEIVFTNPTI